MSLDGGDASPTSHTQAVAQRQLAALDTSVDVNQLVPAGSVYAFGAEFQAATVAKGRGLSEVEFVRMLLKYLEHDSDEEDEDEGGGDGDDDAPRTDGAAEEVAGVDAEGEDGKQAEEDSDGVRKSDSTAVRRRPRSWSVWRRRKKKQTVESPMSRLRREFQRRRAVKRLRKKSDLVVDLCELFAQIDVNGDGTVEWPEFTSFCVEAGMVASRLVTRPIKHKFKQRAKYVDRTTTSSRITFMRYCPAMDCVLVCEEGSVDLKVYTPELRLVRVLHVALPLPDKFAMRKPSAPDVMIATDNATRFASVRQKYSKKHRSAVQGITAARLSKPRKKKTVKVAQPGLLSGADRELLDRARAEEKAAEEEAKRQNILTAGRAKQGLDDDVLVVPRDLLRGRARRKYVGKVLSVSLAATRRVFKQAKRRAAERRRNMSDAKVANEEAGVQDSDGRWSLGGAAHIPELKLIAVACDDCTITLWREETFEFHGALHPHSPQTALRWCPDTGLLLSGCAKGSLTAWSVETLRQSVRLGVDTVPLRTMDGRARTGRHTGTVMDVVEVAAHKLIISAGMDSRVALWSYDNDDKRLRFTGDLGTFAHGVRQLVYMPAADVLVTVGFGHDVTAWDLSSRLLLCTISGHRHTVLCACVTSSRPQCLVTADAAGTFKVWLIQRNTLHNTPPLLQTFDAESELATFAPACMTAVGASHALVCGARRLVIFDSVRKIDLDESPALGLYCDKRSSFVTANGDGLGVWSAFDGKNTDKFYNLAPGAITTLAVDRRQRKVILGSSSGDVVVVNSRNGYVMKRCKPHQGDVTAVVYCPSEQTIVSVSWDRQLVVHDEKPNSEECATLRTVVNAHDADINCLDFSRELSLLGTGAADGTLRMWDFQSVKLVGVCEGHEHEITSVKFCRDLPLMVATDASGLGLFWATRPSLWSCRCMLGFRNLGAGPIAAFVSLSPLWAWPYLAHPASRHPVVAITQKPVIGSSTPDKASKAYPADHIGAVPITSMDLHSQHDSQGNKVVWVFTGDEQGMVKLWDATPFCNLLPIHPVAPEKQACNLGSYNPRVRLRRVFAGVNHGGITAKERPFQASKHGQVVHPDKADVRACPHLPDMDSVRWRQAIHESARRRSSAKGRVGKSAGKGRAGKGAGKGKGKGGGRRTSTLGSSEKGKKGRTGRRKSPPPLRRGGSSRRSIGKGESGSKGSPSRQGEKEVKSPPKRDGSGGDEESLGLMRGASVKTLMSGRGDDIPEIVETASFTTGSVLPLPDMPDDALDSGIHPVTRGLLARTLTLRRMEARKELAAKHLATLSVEERAMVRFAGTMRGIHATMRAKRRAKAKLQAQKNFTPREWALSRVRGDLQAAVMWKAGNDAIKDVRFVEEPRSVITTSHDNSIRVWTPVGEPLGVLNATAADIRGGIRRMVPWRFRIDIAARKQALIDHARRVAHNMVHADVQRAKAAQRRKTAANLMTAARTARSVSTFREYARKMGGAVTDRSHGHGGPPVPYARSSRHGHDDGGDGVAPVLALMERLGAGTWDSGIDDDGAEARGAVREALEASRAEVQEEARAETLGETLGEALGDAPAATVGESGSPDNAGGVGSNTDATGLADEMANLDKVMAAAKAQQAEDAADQLRSHILRQVVPRRNSQKYNAEVVMLSQLASAVPLSGTQATKRTRPASAPAARRGITQALPGSPDSPSRRVRPGSAAPRRTPSGNDLRVQAQVGTDVAHHAVRSRSINPLAAAAMGRAQAQTIAQLTSRGEGEDERSGGGAPQGSGAGSGGLVRQASFASVGSSDGLAAAARAHVTPSQVTALNFSALRDRTPGASPRPSAAHGGGGRGGGGGGAMGVMGGTTTTSLGLSMTAQQRNEAAIQAMQQAEMQVLQENSQSTVAASDAPDLAELAARNVARRQQQQHVTYENYEREAKIVAPRAASVLDQEVDTTPSAFLRAKLHFDPSGKMKAPEVPAFGSTRSGKQRSKRPGTAPARRSRDAPVPRYAQPRGSTQAASKDASVRARRTSSSANVRTATGRAGANVSIAAYAQGAGGDDGSTPRSHRRPMSASAYSTPTRSASATALTARGKPSGGRPPLRHSTSQRTVPGAQQQRPPLLRSMSSVPAPLERRQSFKIRIQAAKSASPWLEKAIADATPRTERSAGSGAYAQTIPSARAPLDPSILAPAKREHLRQRMGRTMDRFQRMMEETKQDKQALAAIRGKLGDHWASASRKTLIQRQAEYAVRLRPEGESSSSDDDDASTASADERARKRRARQRSAAAETWNNRRFGDYSLHDVVAFKRMYHEIDTDGSGTINIDEFMHSDSFRSSQMFYMSKSVFKSLDSDGSGNIEIDELLPVVFPLATKRQLREIAQEVLVRIRDDIMSAEAKRMKWQQGGAASEEASTAKVDEAVKKFGTRVSRGAAEAAVGAVNLLRDLGAAKQARQDELVQRRAAGETASQLHVSKKAAAAARGLARFSEITSRTVSKLRARVAGSRLRVEEESDDAMSSASSADLPASFGKLQGIARGLYSS